MKIAVLKKVLNNKYKTTHIIEKKIYFLSVKYVKIIIKNKKINMKCYYNIIFNNASYISR